VGQAEILFKIIPRRPRFLNAIVACLGGYFWLPCPICGKNFAGYELIGCIYTSWTTGKGVCWRCSEKAGEKNAEFLKLNPPPPVAITGAGVLKD